MEHVRWFSSLSLRDLDQVGGKNASLGEMIQHLTNAGVNVPNGFATTSDSFHAFMSQNGLATQIKSLLASLDVTNIKQLADTAKQIRELILNTPLLPDTEAAVRAAYSLLSQQAGGEFSVAVRSSATAEDLPDASFAGQQETILNVRGVDNVLLAIHKVFASLFTDRAIAYREHHGFDHMQVGLSAGVQLMVRSDLGASGVLFTIDTESGFDKVIFITSSYGLGEMVVQGAVNPDEFFLYKPAIQVDKPPILRRTLGSKRQKMIYSADGASSTTTIVEVPESEQWKFSLSDDDLVFLGQQALIIEEHYGCPMDVEWARDGITGKIYILQARPETVQSRKGKQILERYQLNQRGPVLTEGRSIGQKIGKGTAKIIRNLEDMNLLQPGEVLVTDMTDPDWEPVLKRASAIITNRGGRTCHAAIVARELGIPAVVGCGDATQTISNGTQVTVSCAEGDTGFVYQGLCDFEIKTIDIDNLPKLPLNIMLNVGNPNRAFAFQALPNSGVGLARLEFIISNTIGIHPKALLNYSSLPSEIKAQIDPKIQAYGDPIEFYVERLKEGIATIAAAFYPKRVIVRLSDFKSNEYASLIGGQLYEPHEENPMLGFRGASRYVSPEFADCFALECQAVKRVREEMNLINVDVMIPFVRTLSEAERVIQVLKSNGLEKGKNGLRLIMMCELPSNALMADEFLEFFDGFSIGSNDLTQLTLGLDRDSGLIAYQFDERDPAIKKLLHQAIQAAKKAGKYIGICGQGPSDHPDFAEWLMKEGIDSVSLNPDSVVETCLFLSEQNLH